MKEVRELHITEKELSGESMSFVLSDLMAWCEDQESQGYSKFRFRPSYQTEESVCIVCSKEVSESESPS